MPCRRQMMTLPLHRDCSGSLCNEAGGLMTRWLSPNCPKKKWSKRTPTENQPPPRTQHQTAPGNRTGSHCCSRNLLTSIINPPSPTMSNGSYITCRMSWLLHSHVCSIETGNLKASQKPKHLPSKKRATDIPIPQKDDPWRGAVYSSKVSWHSTIWWPNCRFQGMFTFEHISMSNPDFLHLFPNFLGKRWFLGSLVKHLSTTPDFCSPKPSVFRAHRTVYCKKLSSWPEREHTA